jgi:DeoR/GlpR family transcriptional regulator of sugar metabolism
VTEASRRRDAIAMSVAQSGQVSVAELTETLGVSAMTVRRDLELLEEQGLIRRVRGGALARISNAYEPPYVGRAAQHSEAKQRIAKAAVDLVIDGDTIVLDTGTTSLEVAYALRGRKVITVVTAALRVAMELANEPDIRVVVAGGFIRPGELSLVGTLAENVFNEFNCDTAFIGVGGVHPTKGITDYNPDDARIKRLAVAAAARKVVLADASKLGRAAFVNVATADEIDVLITDASGDNPTLRALSDVGVSVITV